MVVLWLHVELMVKGERMFLVRVFSVLNIFQETLLSSLFCELHFGISTFLAFKVRVCEKGGGRLTREKNYK